MSVTDIKEFNILNVQDILRAQHVHRWTIVNTSRPQNLAEHTFGVVAIARAIAREYGIDDINIMKYAFDHDLDEILSGDIPTPAKDRLGIRDDYKGKNKEKCSNEEIAIVAIADVMEAVYYLNEHGLGQHASKVMDGMIDRLNQRIALYAGTNRKLQDAMGKVVGMINSGDFVNE